MDVTRNDFYSAIWNHNCGNTTVGKGAAYGCKCCSLALALLQLIDMKGRDGYGNTGHFNDDN